MIILSKPRVVNTYFTNIHITFFITVDKSDFIIYNMYYENVYALSRNKAMYRCFIKRLLDIICALLAMILFCWLYALIALLVRIKLGSPVLFVQERPGKNGRIFRLYKFRTMTNKKDENGNLLPDDKRFTNFGMLLRYLSLDELPEAFNILKGDMSVVGPRPLLVKYLPLYSERQARRHEVRPGLTGYAQVNGRNSITWEEKFEYDVWYVDNISFMTDVKIVAKTVEAVFRHQGIYGNTPETLEEFKGNTSAENERI